MKIRISLLTTIALFGVITALGLFAILAVSIYSNSQLRVGGPLYSQIKLGNDLVADVLPPPAYVIEAYLEATLALQEPSKTSAHKERLAQLHKEFDERQEFWKKSDLDPTLKSNLTVKSNAEVQRFWTLTEKDLLPALDKSDRVAAEKPYAELTSVYAAHRAIIDGIVKKANADNTELEAAAAKQVTTFSTLVWSVSGVVVLIIGLGIAGIAIGVIRPVVRMTAAVTQMAAGNLEILIPGANRADEIGDMAKAIGVVRENAERKSRDEAEAKIKQDQVAAQQRKTDMIKLADDFEGAVGEIVETVSSASTELEASAGTLTATATRAQELTIMVAAASEEASTNVQSVASATEEMASSVNEISRQVQESARMANEAVDQAAGPMIASANYRRRPPASATWSN